MNSTLSQPSPNLLQSRLVLIHALPFSIDILYLYLRYSVSLPPIFCISTSDILYLYLRYSVSLPSDNLYLYLRYSVSLPLIFFISTSNILCLYLRYSLSLPSDTLPSIIIISTLQYFLWYSLWYSVSLYLRCSLFLLSDNLYLWPPILYISTFQEACISNLL